MLDLAEKVVLSVMGYSLKISSGSFRKESLHLRKISEYLMKPTPVGVGFSSYKNVLFVKRTQVDKQVFQLFRIVGILQNILQQFLLAGLAKGETVQGKDLDQTFIGVFITAEGVHGHDSFDADHVRLLCNAPVGDQIGTACCLFCFFCVRKHLGPNIVAKRNAAITVSDVLANGETFEAIDTAFPLFQIDGIGGEIPMDDPAAVVMKIQTFLTNGGRGQHKGTEWGVERIVFGIFLSIFNHRRHWN